MATQWDLAAYNKENQPALVVEAKAKMGTSVQWAKDLRRNWRAHGLFANVPYFLLACPDRFYLWTRERAGDHADEPVVIDAQPFLAAYFDKAGIAPQRIHGSSFEILLAGWLGRIMDMEAKEFVDDPHLRWLLETGLHAALSGGRLEHEVVV